MTETDIRRSVYFQCHRPSGAIYHRIRQFQSADVDRDWDDLGGRARRNRLRCPLAGQGGGFLASWSLSLSFSLSLSLSLSLSFSLSL